MSTRILGDWLDSYLTFVDNSEPPSSYKLWTGISVLAASMRRKCVLHWGTLTFYPNMYIVLVGPSGCRKGTAMGPGMSMLDDIGIKIAAESITREALIRELKQSNATEVDPSTGTMHLHSSLTIFSQELTVFLGYNNGALMADLADWYDCRSRWTYRTKLSGTDDIIGVWVNLIGATTPELLQNTLPRDAIGGGLASRIIFVYEQKKGKICPTPFQSRQELSLKKDLIMDLEKVSVMSGEFSITDDFVDAWIDWYTNLDKKGTPFEDYKFAGYFERRPTHILKLCMILSASRSSSREITVYDFERAKSILTMTEKKMPYTFSGVGRSNNSDITQRIMTLVATRKVINIGEVMRIFYQDIDKWGLDKVIETMVQMGFCEIQYNGHDKMIVCIDESQALF